MILVDAPWRRRAPSLPRWFVHPEDVSVDLDVRSELGAVLSALRCYRSQVYGATIPALDMGTKGGAGEMSTRDAAVGWYALSDDAAQPIYPVVSLQLAWGSVQELGLGPDARSVDTSAPPPAPSARMVLARGGTGLLLGVVTGVVGTLVCRAEAWGLPYGMVLAAALVIVAGLLVRALVHGWGLVGFGLGVLASVQGLALWTHGSQDVLIPADGLGSAWLVVSMGAVAVAAFAPRRWVGERT